MAPNEFEALLQPEGELGKEAKRLARKFERRWEWLWPQAAMDRQDIAQEMLKAVIIAVRTFAESHPKNPAASSKEQFLVYAYDLMPKSILNVVRHHLAKKRRPEKGQYSLDALKSSATKSRTGRRSSPKVFTVASQRDA
jgi:hypothetical protein